MFQNLLLGSESVSIKQRIKHMLSVNGTKGQDASGWADGDVCEGAVGSSKETYS